MYYTHIQEKAKVMCIYMVYMYTLLFIFMFRTRYNLYCIKNVVSMEKCIVYTLHIFYIYYLFIFILCCV